MSIKGKNLIQSSKSTAQLQVEKAGVLNDVTRLLGEVNTLSAQKVKLQRDVELEMALYNSMVLKTTAEMQADLEDKVKEHKGTLQALDQAIKNINQQIELKQEELKKLIASLESLKIEIDQTRVRFTRDNKAAKDELEQTKIDVLAAKKALQDTLQEMTVAKKHMEEAKKNTEFFKQSQVEYAKFLERKARDLSIWEERLKPAFKEKFPEGEMAFV